MVDDGSFPGPADKNAKICRSHEVNYERMDKNRGMSVARNRGIAKSSGEWIVFIDDDFCVEPSWYETLKRTLRSLGGEVIGVEGRIEPAGSGLWDKEVQNRSGGLYLTCHIAYRRKTITEIGGFDPQFEFLGPFAEDHELAARALRWGTIIFAPELQGVHLPRRIKLLPYVASSFRRIRALLNCECFFFCKQADRYHAFRHSRTFWGTYLSILFRHGINNLRRRPLADCLRHPVQLASLLAASLLEQIAAWFMLPMMVSKIIHEKPCRFHTLIDEERTARLWRLSNPVYAMMLRFHISHLRSLFFPIIKLPVYDKRPLMQRIALVSSLDSCIFLLRIDDVFLQQKETVERFIQVMARKKYPYLAGVTGDDCTNPSYVPFIERLRESGAEIAIHGFSHAGHFGPFASEILQMTFPDLAKKISAVAGSNVFKNHPPFAFMPPYNAVAGEQIPFLCRIFDLVTGGPETSRFTDRFAGPVAIKNSGWYVPTSYPFYSSAGRLLKEDVIGQIPGIKGFICISLHLEQEEKDGFSALSRLLDALPRPPLSWRHFTKDSSGEAYFTGDRKDT